jgi:hypothetical protein
LRDVSASPTTPAPSIAVKEKSAFEDQDVEANDTSVRRRFVDRYSLLPLVGYLATFVVTYIACLTTPYAFEDDYPALADAMKHSLDSEVRARMLAGRPTLALLFNVTFQNVHSLADLRIVRLLGVFGITILAWLLYRTLRWAGMNTLLALLLPVFICTLPPIQVYMAWAIASIAIYSTVLAGLALITVEYATRKVANLRAAVWRQRMLALLLFPAAVGLLLLALTIAQDTAMFYWVFAAIILFVSGQPLSWVARRLGLYAAVAVAAMVPAFLVVKYLPVWAYGTSALADQTTARNQLLNPSDAMTKAEWFLTNPLQNALNLDNIQPTLPWAALAGTVILVGLVLYFTGGIGTRLGKLAVALALLPVTYTANLVVAENWSSYRTQVALTALIALYAALAVSGFARFIESALSTLPALPRGAISRALLPSIFFVGTFVGIVLAAQNMTLEFALPEYIEYHLLVSQLKASSLGQAKSIMFIQPYWTDSQAPFVRYDEFGLPSSEQPWVPTPMIYIALSEVDARFASLPVQSMSLPDAAPAPTPQPGVVLIDMRQLRNFNSTG